MNQLVRIVTGLAMLSGTAALAQNVPTPSEVSYSEYGAVEASLTGKPGDPAEGAKVISDKSLGNCVACHELSSMPDVPFQGDVGPSLDAVGDRWSEGELRGIVANAKQTFPGTIMPAFYKNSGYIRPGDGFTGKAAKGELEPLLSPQQIEDVVAYLMTLRES